MLMLDVCCLTNHPQRFHKGDVARCSTLRAWVRQVFKHHASSTKHEASSIQRQAPRLNRQIPSIESRASSINRQALSIEIQHQAAGIKPDGSKTGQNWHVRHLKGFRSVPKDDFESLLASKTSRGIPKPRASSVRMIPVVASNDLMREQCTIPNHPEPYKNKK